MELYLIKWAQIIFGLIGVPVALFNISKVRFDISSSQQSQRREEYKFAKDFLEEIKNNPDMHPFAREKRYKAIAPDKQPGVGLRDKLGAKEIEYLLSLQRPEQALENYIRGRSYLENIFDNDILYNRTPQIAFKEKYQCPWSRRWRKAWYFFGYWFFGYLAIPFIPTLAVITLIMLDLNLELLLQKFNWATWAIIQVAFLFGFGPVAWLSLGVVTGINRAEELVNGVVPPGLFQELWEHLLGLKKALLSFPNRGK